jgi:hypothetical protein
MCSIYVLLIVHPCTISQISPIRCTILFNIFIYLSSLHVPGIHAGWIENPTSGPDATNTEWQIPVSYRYSEFLLIMGMWMPETCREEK